MIGGSIPKLLQISGETKEALSKISAELLADVSVAEITTKIADLQSLSTGTLSVKADWQFGDFRRCS